MPPKNVRRPFPQNKTKLDDIFEELLELKRQQVSLRPNTNIKLPEAFQTNVGKLVHVGTYFVRYKTL